MICVVSYVQKEQYREKFVTEKQLNNLKKELVNNKIKDLTLIGTQVEISEFLKNA